ncbi:uncharacterized protein LOC144448176 [Glandiceps talaboti]
MTDQEYDDAKKNHTTLICPNPVGNLKRTLKDEIPREDWLYSWPIYFPDIIEIKNIKIILGMAMITSEAALFTKDHYLRNANYYIAHLWPNNEFPSIVGFAKSELEIRLSEKLTDEVRRAQTMVSIDNRTFDYFGKMFGEWHDKHFNVVPVPEPTFLAVREPSVSTLNWVFRVISFHEDDDFENMESHQLLAKALNEVTKVYYDMKQHTLKWRILGISEAKETFNREKLGPHSQLDIVPSSMPSVEFMKGELLAAHLMLIPPTTGMNSYHLMFTAMAVGIPFLVSRYTPCHDMIREHFLEYEDDVVVDMKDVDQFSRKIISILKSQELFRSKARDIKTELQNTVLSSLDSVNSRFLKRMRLDLADSESDKGQAEGINIHHVTGQDDPHYNSSETGIPTKRQKIQHSSGGEEVHESGGVLGVPEHMETWPTIASEQDADNPGTARMHLHINTAGGIPKSGYSIKAVENAYFKLPEVLGEAPQRISDSHPGIHVEGASGNSVMYTIACETLDALEFLWKKYETLELNKLITSTTITEKTLGKIGALYLSIRITMDIEEYELSRRNLRQKKGRITQQPLAEVSSGGEVNRQLQLEVEHLKATVSALREEVHEKDNRIEILQGNEVEFAIHKELMKDKDSEIKVMKLDLQSWEKKANALVDKNIKLQKKTDQPNENERRLGDENIKLKAELKRLKEEVEDLKVKNQAKQEEISTLEMENRAFDYKGEWSLSYSLDGRDDEVQLTKQHGLAINPHGEVAVADTDNHRVNILNYEYKSIAEIRFDDQFTNEFQPLDIAVTENDEYLMTDVGNKQVVFYQRQTDKMQIFCQKDGIDPRSIALMAGHFVVTDKKGRKVVKYDLIGHSVGEITGSGEAGQLLNPKYVAVNSDDNVIVSDKGKAWNDDSIKVYNKELQYLFTLDSKLRYPFGISVDKWDNVYVIVTGWQPEASAGRIYKYTKRGKKVYEIGEGELTWPRHLLVTKDDPPRIMVSEPRENRIKIFTVK